MLTIDVPVALWQGEYAACPDKSAGVIGGVACGKTFINSDWLTVMRAGTWPMSASAVIGATRKQLKEGTLVTLAGRLDDLQIKHRQNLSDLSTTLLSAGYRGHRIQAWSVENRAYLRLKSLEFDTIWADELQIWEAGRPALDYLFTRNRPSPYVAACIERVRRARAAGVEPDPTDLHYASMQPQLRFSANPPWSTGHWLHTTFIEPQDDEGNTIEAAADDTGEHVKVWRVSTLDNPLLPRRDEFIANLKARMPPDVFRIEVLGESGDVGVGRVYTSFYKQRAISPVRELPCVVERNGRLEIDFNPRLPLIWMHDFGVNPRTWMVGQVHRLRKPIPGFQEWMVYLLDEAWLMGGDTLKAIGTFVERYPHADWPKVYIFGDAAGSSPNSVTGQSDWGQIQSDARLRPYEFTIYKKKANPPIVDRVLAMNAKLCNANDEIGVLVHPRCKRFINDAQQTRWVEGQRKLDHGSRQKEIFLTHMTDEVGYFIDRQWPIQIRSGLRKVGEGTTIR